MVEKLPEDRVFDLIEALGGEIRKRSFDITETFYAWRKAGENSKFDPKKCGKASCGQRIFDRRTSGERDGNAAFHGFLESSKVYRPGQNLYSVRLAKSLP